VDYGGGDHGCVWLVGRSSLCGRRIGLRFIGCTVYACFDCDMNSAVAAAIGYAACGAIQLSVVCLCLWRDEQTTYELESESCCEFFFYFRGVLRPSTSIVLPVVDTKDEKPRRSEGSSCPDQLDVVAIFVATFRRCNCYGSLVDPAGAQCARKLKAARRGSSWWCKIDRASSDTPTNRRQTIYATT